MIHYQMTLDEHQTARGSYVDPDRYREGHRDFQPEMICRTGDGHAIGTRERNKVDCPQCLAKLPDYFKQSDPLPIHLREMTGTKWNSLSPAQRAAMVDRSHLTPQLEGLEGCRVEVVDMAGERRRFQVGKSTGWRPCHLELRNSRSTGGDPARARYQSVRKVR